MAAIAETRKLETYSVGAVAAFYAWASKTNTPLGPVWFLPLLIVLFGAARSFAVAGRIAEIAKYIRQRLEALVPDEGWETYFQQVVLAKQHVPGSRIAPTAVAFWLIALAITVGAPFVLAVPSC